MCSMIDEAPKKESLLVRVIACFRFLVFLAVKKGDTFGIQRVCFRLFQFMF